MDGMPKSRAALERAIVRYAGNDTIRANELAVAFAILAIRAFAHAMASSTVGRTGRLPFCAE